VKKNDTRRESNNKRIAYFSKSGIKLQRKEIPHQNPSSLETSQACDNQSRQITRLQLHKERNQIMSDMHSTKFDLLKWRKYHPLSDKNAFICLVDVMGDDSSIVQAARVSYGNDEQDLDNIALKIAQKQFPEATDFTGHIDYSDPDFTVTIWKDNEVLYEGPNKWAHEYSDALDKQFKSDRQLIRYLMNHSHTTPFEMVEIKFMVQVPMDCWRQWIRHRTANVNEYSTRYTEALDMQQTTLPGEWRLQAIDNKQGSSGFLEEWPEGMASNHPNQTPGEWLTEDEEFYHKSARLTYNRRLSLGIAKEQARKDLPLSTYTRAYWKCDLHNIFNFLRLRMDSHAQLEIRSFANSMFEIVKQICPVACEAFEDYVLGAKRFSRMEMETLKILIARGVEKTQVMEAFSYDDTMSREDADKEWSGRLKQAISETTDKPSNMTDREWKEFLGKLS